MHITNIHEQAAVQLVDRAKPMKNGDKIQLIVESSKIKRTERSWFNK